MKEQYLWTPDRDLWLKTNAKNLTIKELQSHLRLNKEVIKNRCRVLGVKWKPSVGRVPTWTPQEDERLLAMTAEGNTWENIGRKLGKRGFQCHRRYNSLQGEKHWTDYEVKLLLNLVKSGYGYTRIGLRLGKHPDACQGKYLEIQKQAKPTITIAQIEQSNLSPSQKEMAISLYVQDKKWAQNYFDKAEKAIASALKTNNQA